MSDGAGGTPSRQALFVGIGCFVLWGAMPLLFIALGRMGASPWEIVGQRALWSAPWAGLLVLLARQGGHVRQAFARPGTVAWLALSAALIASGWGVFVWAVNNGHNLEASLGYYLNPLLNMAVGAAIFRERMNRFGVAAVALATVGVALQTVALGRLPMISLFLALTFLGYGLIRKKLAVEAQAGLFIECLLIAVPGVAYVIWLAHAGGGVFGRSLGPSLLMATVGPATVIPLALFAWIARRLPLSTIGFMQFIGPTMGFFIGLSLGETLPPLGIVAFAFIWAGAAMFGLGAWRTARRIQRPA
ncbi:MAG: EamA family transporter RarD [Caulobacteraceae bacterium]